MLITQILNRNDKNFGLVNEAITKKYPWITKRHLCSKKRDSDIALARHIAWYILKEIYKIRWSSIGEYYKKDHTSIIHGVRRVEKTPEILQEAKVIINLIPHFDESKRIQVPGLPEVGSAAATVQNKPDPNMLMSNEHPKELDPIYAGKSDQYRS